MAKKETKNYVVKYRILDEPGIRELYHGISALSVIQATDLAEKMLINDGLEFSSFEITEVKEAEESNSPEEAIDKLFSTTKSWDGYDIPKSCQDKNKECGKCYLEKEARTRIGCTVPLE